MGIQEDAERLVGIVFGFAPAQVVRTVAALDLVTALAGLGPVTADGLARCTGLHAPSLLRLLRAAAHLGLVAADEQCRFTPTTTGELLRSDVDFSLRPLALGIVSEPTWSAVRELGHTVATGQPGVEKAFGCSSYEFIATHAEHRETFYWYLAESARADAGALVGAVDLAGASTVVDVGGSHGETMAALLSAHPHLHGTIVDVAAGLSTAGAALAQSGVADRCDLHPADFLNDALPSDADVYVVKNVLSDWPDADALALLRNCARSMGPHSTLYVIDMIMPGMDEAANPVAVMSDMFTLVVGGAIRTAAEFETLFAAAGLQWVPVDGNAPEVVGNTVMRLARA